MHADLTTDETFKGITFTIEQPLAGEYENCRFTNCTFSDILLSDIKFIECTFDNCNLSMTKLKNTSFQTVDFIQCKLLGLHFGDCNPFLLEMNFTKCDLNLASFFRLKLKGTKFDDCNLQEADFSEGDFTSSSFANCNLLDATFDNTVLEKADFRNAYNYTIDPVSNHIRKAKFSQSGIAGLLFRHDITIE